MLENADLLVQEMKQEIDSILSGYENLQKFLVWVEEKSCSTKSNYKPAAVRSYYLNLARTHALDSYYLNLARIRALDFSFVRALDRSQVLALPVDLHRDLAFDRDLYLILYPDPDPDIYFNLILYYALEFPVDSIELHRLLQQMKNQLPNVSYAISNFNNWWEENGKIWTQQLRSIAIEHRNIGHDWQFSEAQKTLLQKYYDANKLLLDCLNSDCYVSREVREEIESTLFLPISSINKLKSR